jgi:hypothetical protein
MEVQMSKSTNCKFCNNEFSTRSIGGHTKFCDKNPDKNFHIEKLKKARNSINEESHLKSSAAVKAAHERGVYDNKVSHKPRPKLSSSQKLKLSEKRKEWLAANPDKHPWKKKSKFDSEPCQNLKAALTDAGVDYNAEFTPLSDRFFSIDIAFPSLKLGIEVNGEQHYNRDGSLRSYYQERHDLIEESGWKLYEIHYSSCYSKEKINSIVKSLIENHDLKNVDLTFEIKQKRIKKTKDEIDQAISEATKGTLWIYNENTRRRVRPEEVEDLISNGWNLGKMNPDDRSHSKRLFSRKFASRQEYTESQKLSQFELDHWQSVLESVDLAKFGFISKIAKQMDCSHKHVRRILSKYFPDVQTFKRK